jgi:hypothetical protein
MATEPAPSLDPVESFRRVAEYHAAREAQTPQIPSPEELTARKFEEASQLVTDLAGYVQHRLDCTKDSSPAAVVAGKLRPCSCGLDATLVSAARFVRSADKPAVAAREAPVPQPDAGAGDADCA